MPHVPRRLTLLTDAEAITTLQPTLLVPGCTMKQQQQ